LEIEAIRTVDVSRYRIRMNLRPEVHRARTVVHASDILAAAWGASVSLEADPGPRVFAVEREGPRTVAESAEMAAGNPHLEAVFNVDGVSEAIAGDGMVLVRLGRMFTWDEREDPVGAALRSVPR
jgi:hypothetical protein